MRLYKVSELCAGDKPLMPSDKTKEANLMGDLVFGLIDQIYRDLAEGVKMHFLDGKLQTFLDAWCDFEEKGKNSPAYPTYRHAWLLYCGKVGVPFRRKNKIVQCMLFEKLRIIYDNGKDYITDAIVCDHPTKNVLIIAMVPNVCDITIRDVTLH